MPLADIREPLSEAAVARRVSILKRFRSLLVEQRSRFRSYLEALDNQKKVIAQGSVDELSAHVALEEQILSDIFSIQRSIEPMRVLYELAWSSGGASEVSELTTALDGLRREAAQRAGENKELLYKRLGALRSEIKTMRANPFQRRSHSADSTATLLDVQG